jgi:hypothetical protein
VEPPLTTKLVRKKVAAVPPDVSQNHKPIPIPDNLINQTRRATNDSSPFNAIK